MRLTWIASVILVVVSVPALAAIPAHPGVVNYVEGQASIGNQLLDSKSVGAVELLPGQSLQTANGKVEILLTPGVYFRLGNNSSVKMVSPALANTAVELERGRAMVEVDQIYKANSLQIMEHGATTHLLKAGIYDFDANAGVVRVFDGKAVVSEGDRQVELKSGRELTLNGPLKAEKFNKKTLYSDLYGFSSLRSAYLAESNMNARNYIINTGWYGPGWSGWWWDPWFGAFTFFPADGFFSPFGFGFFPVFVSGGHFHHFDHHRGDFHHGDFRHGQVMSSGGVVTHGQPGGRFSGDPRVSGGAVSGVRPGVAAPRGLAAPGGFHSMGGGSHAMGGGGFHGGGPHR